MIANPNIKLETFVPTDDQVHFIAAKVVLLQQKSIQVIV